MSALDAISDEEIMGMIGKPDPTELTPMQAAAPELYGALLHLVKVLEKAFPSLDNTQSVKSALSALAKARGETP